MGALAIGGNTGGRPIPVGWWQAMQVRAYTAAPRFIWSSEAFTKAPAAAGAAGAGAGAAAA